MEQLCVICKKEPIESLFLPCLHMCTCKSCSSQLNSCCIESCKEYIFKTLHPIKCGTSQVGMEKINTFWDNINTTELCEDLYGGWYELYCAIPEQTGISKDLESHMPDDIKTPFLRTKFLIEHLRDLYPKVTYDIMKSALIKKNFIYVQRKYFP
jgi:hypothetical protein